MQRDGLAVADDARFEALLEDEQAILDAFLETGQFLVCVLDRLGRIVRFNRACEESTGWSAAEVVGRDARETVIPPEEREAFGGVLTKVWETGRPDPQLGHWMARDGGRRLISWANMPIFDEDGVARFLFTSGVDLTDRGPATEELQRLHAQLEQQLREQSALRRVATAVASGLEQEEVLGLVSEEAARVVGAESGAVVRYQEDETALILGRWSAPGLGGIPVGMVVRVDGDGTLVRVKRTGSSARLDDYTGIPGEPAQAIRESGYRSTVAAPVVVGGALWGALVVGTASTVRLPEETEGRLAGFAELISLAISSAHNREQLLESRARLVQASDAERSRLERNLHDGAQQRLVSLALTLKMARDRPDQATRLLEAALVELQEALAELRELARGLHPAILAEHGLRPALGVVAERIPIEVTLEAPEERFPGAIEAAAYYVVSEALTNVAKHARAECASVSVRTLDGQLVVEVSDDGCGGATLDGGSGLKGLRDRVEALRGRFEVESRPGIGTTLRALLPL